VANLNIKVYCSCGNWVPTDVTLTPIIILRHGEHCLHRPVVAPCGIVWRNSRCYGISPLGCRKKQPFCETDFYTCVVLPHTSGQAPKFAIYPAPCIVAQWLTTLKHSGQLRFKMIWLSQSERCSASRASAPEEGEAGGHQTQGWPRRLAVLARDRQLWPAHRVPVGRLACLLLPA
jgi:hypothetical protein